MAVIISPALVGTTAIPLSHPRIGYDNFVPDSTVTATSEASGFPASALKLTMTYERWKPSAMPATATFDAGAAVDVDYVGIASHTLGTESANIELEYSTDNISWTSVDSVSPSSDDAIMILFESVLARYWRVTVSGATAPQLGVVYLGEVLAVERPIYGGHTPGKLSRNTEIRPNLSEGGQYLGRSIIRKGFTTSYDFSNLTAAWYRANFDPFVLSARTDPFFIAWRPDDYPDEVLYAWTSGDIAPSNQGQRNLMSVSFSVRGLG